MERVRPNIVMFLPGEQVPEALCKWTAAPGLISTETEKRLLATPPAHSSWWSQGWSCMEPWGKTTRPFYLLAPQALIDQYYPTFNQWGDICP